MVRFCVIGGGGHIGSGIAREISKHADGSEIIVADINLAKAEEVAREVNGEAIKVDATDAASIKDAVKGSDVVVSAVGPYYKFGAKVLKAVIEAGINFVDIDDDYDATAACLEMSRDAEKAGITAVVGLGATPGITNILAKYGADKMDEVKSINTYWAWTALDPTMGSAIIYHYLHAAAGKIPSYRNGEWVEVPALSDAEIVEFPEPIGCLEVYSVGHPEPVTIPRYLKVKNVTNKGTVWPRIMAELTKYFSMLGFTSLKKISIEGTEIVVRDMIVKLVEHLPEIMPTDVMVEVIQEAVKRFGEQFAFYGVGVGVRVTGEKGGEKKEVAYGVSEVSAVKATALPAALGAIMIADGKIDKTGVHAPEGVIPVKDFLSMLSREIEVREFERAERLLKP